MSSSNSIVVDSNLAPVGSLCSTHTVYEDPFRPKKWTTVKPEIIAPVEDAESAQHALIVRYKSSDNPSKEVDLHSVVIQSHYLKKILGQVLNGYPGITFELERLEINAPFECFIHRWESILAAREELSISKEGSSAEEEENRAITASHLDLLYNLLCQELATELRTKEDLLRNGVMTPKHIWTIFEPGVLVYTKRDGQDRIYRLVSGKWDTKDKLPGFTLECQYIDHNGDSFGMNKTTLRLSSWRGTKKITKLEAYPWKFHEDKDALKQRLVQRGKLFELYKGYHFVAYKGIGHAKVNKNQARFNVDSRIIIDSAASLRYNEKVAMEHFLEDEKFSDAPEPQPEDVHESDDECVVLNAHKEGTPTPPGKAPQVEKETRSALSEEQLMLCTEKVRGYSLRDKKWMKFHIEKITDITWNEEAFDSLVAAQEQKDLILAFAESQAKHPSSFDDFIQGKGKGIIMLLAGPPGVGKTLTAESVAETMKVPLYSIGAAMLGSKPATLEKNLEDILTMCSKWNAVLLLDEADVFMEARSSQDLDRNKLVAIFLRLLEYFEGIMFLTTNRLDHMDAAFESRIHLTLNYTELDKTSRRQVWSRFLTRGAQNADVVQFSDADLDKLARVQLNGRQIKNVLKTAQLLASRADECLNMSHLDVVLKLRKANEKKVGFFGGE